MGEREQVAVQAVAEGEVAAAEARFELGDGVGIEEAVAVEVFERVVGAVQPVFVAECGQGGFALGFCAPEDGFFLDLALGADGEGEALGQVQDGGALEVEVAVQVLRVVGADFAAEGVGDVTDGFEGREVDAEVGVVVAEDSGAADDADVADAVRPEGVGGIGSADAEGGGAVGQEGDDAFCGLVQDQGALGGGLRADAESDDGDAEPGEDCGGVFPVHFGVEVVGAAEEGEVELGVVALDVGVGSGCGC